MLSTSQELKPEAQTYTATVINPSDYPSQGYARSASERSRYTASSSNVIVTLFKWHLAWNNSILSCSTTTRKKTMLKRFRKRKMRRNQIDLHCSWQNLNLPVKTWKMDITLMRGELVTVFGNDNKYDLINAWLVWAAKCSIIAWMEWSIAGNVQRTPFSTRSIWTVCPTLKISAHNRPSSILSTTISTR